MWPHLTFREIHLSHCNCKTFCRKSGLTQQQTSINKIMLPPDTVTPLPAGGVIFRDRCIYRFESLSVFWPALQYSAPTSNPQIKTAAPSIAPSWFLCSKVYETTAHRSHTHRYLSPSMSHWFCFSAELWLIPWEQKSPFVNERGGINALYNPSTWICISLNKVYFIFRILWKSGKIRKPYVKHISFHQSRHLCSIDREDRLLWNWTYRKRG